MCEKTIWILRRHKTHPFKKDFYLVDFTIAGTFDSKSMAMSVAENRNVNPKTKYHYTVGRVTYKK